MRKYQVKNTKWLILIIVCILLGGCTKKSELPPSSNPIIMPIAFSEEQKEISDLVFSDIHGFQFQNIADFEIRINLIHEGKIIQNYANITSNVSNPLEKLLIGYIPKNDIYADIAIKEQSALVNSNCIIDSDFAFDKALENVVKINYNPSTFNCSDNLIILAALIKIPNGTHSNNDEICQKILNTENVSDVQDIYTRLEQEFTGSYCYLIEMHTLNLN